MTPLLDSDSLSQITVNGEYKYFVWSDAKYYLELQYQQAYRGVLLLALHSLEDAHVIASSPLSIKITADIVLRLLPPGFKLPETPNLTYLAYREEVIKEMESILNEDNKSITTTAPEHHKVHEKLDISDPTEILIQPPFLIFRGAKYRLRYDLPANLKDISIQAVDGLAKFNHNFNSDPPPVIKVAGFIAAQVAPESFVSSTQHYYAYRTELVELLPSLAATHGESASGSDHHPLKKSKVTEDQLEPSLQFHRIVSSMELLSISDLLNIIGKAQQILKNRLNFQS